RCVNTTNGQLEKLSGHGFRLKLSGTRSHTLLADRQVTAPPVLAARRSHSKRPRSTQRSQSKTNLCALSDLCGCLFQLFDTSRRIPFRRLRGEGGIRSLRRARPQRFRRNRCAETPKTLKNWRPGTKQVQRFRPATLRLRDAPASFWMERH